MDDGKRTWESETRRVQEEVVTAEESKVEAAGSRIWAVEPLPRVKPLMHSVTKTFPFGAHPSGCTGTGQLDSMACFFAPLSRCEAAPALLNDDEPAAWLWGCLTKILRCKLFFMECALPSFTSERAPSDSWPVAVLSLSQCGMEP